MFGFVGRGVRKIGRVSSKWADVPGLRKFFNFNLGIFNTLFRSAKDDLPNETFSEAVKRLELSEEELKKRSTIFKIQIFIYTAGALLVLLYTIYLGMGSHWMSVLLSFMVVVVLVAQAFKSHFWLFQLKKRKLGCTLQEWLNSSVKES